MGNRYSATVFDDGSASLILATNHSPQALDVPNAASVAWLLNEIMEDAEEHGLRTDGDVIAAQPTPAGIRITLLSRGGNFDLPWRWVVPVIRDLISASPTQPTAAFANV